MARDGSPNVVDCHELFELFRNRYEVSRPVRVRRLERPQPLTISANNASISSRQRSPPFRMLSRITSSMSRNSSVCATTGSPRTTASTRLPSELVHSVNPHAFDQADNSDDDRDRENGVGRRQGALAGIPIVLQDMSTRGTCRRLAFEGSVPRTDAFITRNACAFRIARTDDD